MRPFREGACPRPETWPRAAPPALRSRSHELGVDHMDQSDLRAHGRGEARRYLQRVCGELTAVDRDEDPLESHERHSFPSSLRSLWRSSSRSISFRKLVSPVAGTSVPTALPSCVECEMRSGCVPCIRAPRGALLLDATYWTQASSVASFGGSTSIGMRTTSGTESCPPDVWRSAVALSTLISLPRALSHEVPCSTRAARRPPPPRRAPRPGTWRTDRMRSTARPQ